MKDKAIFFTHHGDNSFEQLNLQIVKKLNPEWDVIPIGFEGYTLLQNSTIAYRDRYPCNISLSCTGEGIPVVDWYSADILFAEAYRHYPNYKSYFFYEYDTICNVPVDSFFDTSVSFFGSDDAYPMRDEWNWIKWYLNFSNSQKLKFGHAGVTTCMFFQNEILKEFYTQVTKNHQKVYNNMFSELRVGTIVGSIGQLRKSRPDIHEYISWDPVHLKLNYEKEFFYHPIKRMPTFFLDKMRKDNIIVV